MDDTSREDLRSPDPRDSQETDPLTGLSDDPRVDPTPDRRQTEPDRRNG